MKKKILLGVGIGFVVVVVAAVVVVGFFLGDVVKKGMNAIGPKVTQTTFTVTRKTKTGFAEIVSGVTRHGQNPSRHLVKTGRHCPTTVGGW